MTAEPAFQRRRSRPNVSDCSISAATSSSAGGCRVARCNGHPDLSRPVYTWITARMVHVYVLGHLLGRSGDLDLAAQALAGLTGRLRDRTSGGWLTSIDAAGESPDEKACYTHAFVVLAASSGAVVGLPGARDLLTTRSGSGTSDSSTLRPECSSTLGTAASPSSTIIGASMPTCTASRPCWPLQM